MKQTKLFNEKINREFGGALSNGKRKIKRPLSLKLPIHIVLKLDSSCKKSLFRRANICNTILNDFAEKFDIKIYERAIATNHIHLVVKVGSRENYRKFIRAFSGKISLLFKLKWFNIPYTRIVTWGREFYMVLSYLLRNQLETEGIIKYQPRQKKRKPPT